ncbi:MAG: formylglycine-generating enzyme family protein [Bacteroidales bacterium]|nr:formylglycine-generating enzyme family protein [Bacteroidales bacterium]MCF8458118.1 formylglycine-generating enzyme family protein [Bacteroidales bacterium]
MKTTTRTIIVLLTISSFFAFTAGKKDKHQFSIKKLDKSFCLIKPGLYANAFEVSNQEYRFFLNDLKKKQTSGWEKHLPDSTGWCHKNGYNDPYKDHYHNHASYQDYPVCNISYNDALAYCAWLTEKYNSAPKKKFAKVKFRLPTIEEWELAARGGYRNTEYAMGGYYLRRYDGQFLYNFKRIGDEGIKSDSTGNPVIAECRHHNLNSTSEYQTSIANAVKSYWPNGFGIYNICGNVAEMVQENGICKGGSVNDFGFDLRIDQQKEYEKPTPNLGFRVFMEVVSSPQ